MASRDITPGSVRTYAVRVTNLKHEVTKEQLCAHFARYGSIESVAVIKRGGHAFVNYFCLSDAMAAEANMNGSLIGGRTVECKVSTEPRHTRRKPPSPCGGSHGKNISTLVHPATHKPQVSKRRPRAKSACEGKKMVAVKLSNLASTTTKESLLDELHNYYSIAPDSVTIIQNARNPHKHGFLNFTCLADAHDAVRSLDCRSIDGNHVKAKVVANDDHPLTPVHTKSLSLLEIICAPFDVERMDSIGFNLPFHHIPLFGQDRIIQKVKKIETEQKVEFQVVPKQIFNEYASVRSFSAKVKQCMAQAGDQIPTCSQLTIFSMEEEETAKWFYKGDGGEFEEYSTEQSRELEKMFQLSFSWKLSIGRFQYTFDLGAMTQCNVLTGKVRAIKRQVVGYERSLRIRVSGRSDIQLSIREFQKIFKDMTITKECHLYKETSRERIIICTKDYFVTTQLLSNKTLQLTGVKGYVERVHLEVEREKLSEREAQMQGVVEFELPTNWTPQREEVILGVVKRGSKEWNKEVQRIHFTLPGVIIIKIERIQNKLLWEWYSFAKIQMEKKNKGDSNEKHLFHGTRDTPPEKIYRSEKGVDFRFSRAGLWGIGAYFAVNASYSNRYAYELPGETYEKQMFICKVLTGDYYNAGETTDQSLRQPPLKPVQDAVEKRYDSVKGNAQGSDIYIIYGHDRVYPAYLVTYRPFALL